MGVGRPPPLRIESAHTKQKKKEIDDDLMAPKEPAMCATIGNMKVSSSHNPAQEEKNLSFFASPKNLETTTTTV